LKERSGRFKFFKKNNDDKFISLFSDSDSRTSTFSIFENDGFYNLGDTFRYKKNFTELEDGGIFHWTSKELFIEQKFSLDTDGFLEISFLITNISTASKSVGMKFILDTDYENEDHFYLMSENTGQVIESEFEIDNPEKIQYWTSAARNTKGAALMSIYTETVPSRVIFGNWDLLDDADYYYNSVKGRAFNNPPYSINDNAVLYLYSPEDLEPQKSIKIEFLFRAIDSVENLNDIIFKKKEVELEVLIIDEEPPVEEQIPEIETSETKPPEVIELEKEEEIIPEIEPEPVIVTEEVPDVIPPIEAPQVEIPAEETEKEPIEEIQITEDPVTEQLNNIKEIKDIIESISRPGIITEENLSELENLINKLEDIGIDEN